MITKESPLQGMKIGTASQVIIRELPGLSMIDLRVAPGSSSFNAVREALGMDLPAKTCLTSVHGDTIILGLSPDWWLIIGSASVEQKLVQLGINNDYHFSVVDVSGQRTTIELEGPAAREILAHLWEQDLREKTFPIGSVSQGLMAKAPVIIVHSGSHRYRIIVRSSFALHLWKAVTDAAEEYI